MPILLEEDNRLPLPRMFRVRQSFCEDHIPDPAAQVRHTLAAPEIASAILPGQRVAVAVGSRGIRGLLQIVQTVIGCLQAQGAQPFVVSAMGSHGGGTEEGQREVLAGYGITPQALGVPVVTTVDTLQLGTTSGGVPVYFDRAAYEADAIVVINRVKLHTDFVGPLQSGLCKMLVIGLGNHRGCSAIHEEDPTRFAAILEEAASILLQKAPVAYGIAVLENAYDQTLAIEALPAAHLIAREKELVATARDNMPCILLPQADLIVCGAVGKDISGAGFDPNILGRSTVLKTFVLPIPRYQRLILLDVSPASHGNAIGAGLFDVITQKVYSQLDLPAMYANAIACNCIEDVKIPLVAADEQEAVRVAAKCCRGIDRAGLRIIRIANTLQLEYLEVSEALLDDVRADPRLTLQEELLEPWHGASL